VVEGPKRPVVPAYGSGALADLLPAVSASLGAPGATDVIGLPEAAKVVLLLVDGLGSEILARVDPSVAPVLRELAAASPTLTTGFPSTTSTSLVSLATGLPPGTHGVMGYQFRVRGHGLLNALLWPDDLDPAAVQTHPNLLTGLGEHGVSVSHVGPRAYTSTGLSRAAMAGTTYTGADTPGEKVAATVEALGVEGPVLVNTYVGELDNTGHLHGVDSTAWRAQLGHVDRFVEQLLAALPADGLLLVTGDHGMVDSRPEAVIDVEADPDLATGVALLGGEPRARHVYAEEGAAADVLAAWRERLAGVAWVRSREEAVAEGWFGAVDREVADRIGDVVAACHAPGALLTAGRTAPHETLLKGHHGSLTIDEAVVPLLMAQGGAT
jgi:hypothetical protein